MKFFSFFSFFISIKKTSHIINKNNQKSIKNPQRSPDRLSFVRLYARSLANNSLLLSLTLCITLSVPISLAHANEKQKDPENSKQRAKHSQIIDRVELQNLKDNKAEQKDWINHREAKIKEHRESETKEKLYEREKQINISSFVL